MGKYDKQLKIVQSYKAAGTKDDKYNTNSCSVTLKQGDQYAVSYYGQNANRNKTFYCRLNGTDVPTSGTASVDGTLQVYYSFDRQGTESEQNTNAIVIAYTT